MEKSLSLLVEEVVSNACYLLDEAFVNTEAIENFVRKETEEFLQSLSTGELRDSFLKYDYDDPDEKLDEVTDKLLDKFMKALNAPEEVSRTDWWQCDVKSDLRGNIQSCIADYSEDVKRNLVAESETPDVKSD